MPEEETDPALTGPYSTDNGEDAFGHPVNGFGRCEKINMEPPQCPPEEEN